MGSFRIASFLGLLAAFAGCGYREPARDIPKEVPTVEAVPTTPFERLAAATVTVSYPIPYGTDGGARLMNYSGIALDATHVLTVIVSDLPAAAKAPTIRFEEQASPGSPWNFETVPGKEILLTEIGMQVLTSEEPLRGTAMPAAGFDIPLGADIWVIGTYAEGLDGMVMRGNVAKMGGLSHDEDLFLINAPLSRSSAGAGVYDDRHALVGIVVAPFIAEELGLIWTDTGAVIKVQTVVKALREHGFTFSLDKSP